MTLTSTAPRPIISQKLVIDCRGIAGVSAESVVAWMTTFPQPSKVHVVLPSSTPGVRRLQCALQSLGCGVTRVTKGVASRSQYPHTSLDPAFVADFS